MFGDYEPLSAVTVDRKYFTSDPVLFQDIFKTISCQNGGIIKNAVEEGMVAALEVICRLTVYFYISLNSFVFSYLMNIKNIWMEENLFNTVFFYQIVFLIK